MFHVEDTVHFVFPIEALLAFVAFVGARGGMSLRLGSFLDMENGRAVGLAHRFDGYGEELYETGIVPCFTGVDIYPTPFVVGLEPGQHLRDTAFGGLDAGGHRDAVAVVPYENGEGCLGYARRVDDLPKRALGGACVADGTEANLLAVARETLFILQFRADAVVFGGQGKPQGAAHLAAGAGNIRGDVIVVDVVCPLTALFVYERGGIVVVHLAATGEGVVLRIGIQLGEVRLHRSHPKGEHEGLVAVIPGPEVARTENPGERDLWDFLPVPGHPEFCFAGQDLLAGQKARLTAQAADFKIAQNAFFWKKRR